MQKGNDDGPTSRFEDSRLPCDVPCFVMQPTGSTHTHHSCAWEVKNMTTFEIPFDDSKLYESIFGENQRWNPEQATAGTYQRLSDEWSAIASANKEAADRLVDGLRRGPLSELYLSYPIMACYRHYLETRLKGILFQLQGWKILAEILAGENDDQPSIGYNHQLMPVWKRVRELLYKIDASELAIEGVREEIDEKYDAIEARIKEFNDIDKRATTFRYPEEKSGEPTLGTPLYEEELLQVKGAVEALEFYLAGISCGVHESSNEVLEALEFHRQLDAECAWHWHDEAADYIQ